MGRRFHYFLGTHQPNWLTETRVPLFISFSRLNRYKTLPRSRSAWAMDSGAFSQLYTNGKWTWSPQKYADEVRRIAEEVGLLQWASIQDWLCTPAVLRCTRLSIRAHQRNTVRSLVTLRTLAPEIRWLPILQGWNVRSYLNHLAMYESQGFMLASEPLVGVGSLAIRQTSSEVASLLRALHDQGLRIHAFGLSITGLRSVHPLIESSDSMVWSFVARRRKIKHAGCRQVHTVCNNCLSYALAWRRRVVSQIQSMG